MGVLNSYFGQLRSLLQSGEHVYSAHVKRLLHEAYMADKERYKDQFLGYLSAFDLPEIEALSKRELLLWNELFPKNISVVFFPDGAETAKFGQLFAGPHFERVTKLHMSYKGLTNDEMEILVRVYFPRLRSLFLNGNSFRNRGVEMLARARANFPVLEELELGANYVSARVCHEYFDREEWGTLEYLGFGDSRVR